MSSAAVLFVAANPTNTPNLNTGKELKAVSDRVGPNNQRFRFFGKPGAIKANVFDLLAQIDNEEVPPHTFHLCTPLTEGEEVVFEDETISHESLKQVLSILEVPSRWMCLVIPALEPDRIAPLFVHLAQHVLIVHPSFPIEARITFFQKFYEYLLEKNFKVDKAFKWARRQVQQDHLDIDEALYPTLRIPQSIHQTKLPVISLLDNREKDRLYQYLLEFNYRDQLGQFWNCLQRRSSVCLIHGKPDYEQRWLFNKLLEEVERDPKIILTPPLTIESTAHSPIETLEHLIDRLKAYFDLKQAANQTGAFKDELVSKLKQALKGSTYIIRITDPTNIPLAVLRSFFIEIWLPTMNAVEHEDRLAKSPQRLLLFLVETQQEVKSSDPALDHLDHFLEQLPGIKPFGFEDFNLWMTTAGRLTSVRQILHPYNHRDKYQKLIADAQIKCETMPEAAVPKKFFEKLFPGYVDQCRFY